MDPTDTAVLERALAETYTARSAASAWGLVEQYRDVQRHAVDNPDRGSVAVASAFDLPRGRVRPWIEGDAVPPPVRAIRTAGRRGWLDLSWRGATFAGVNALVAWTLAGGSIAAETWVPAWTADDRTRADLRAALGRIGAGVETRHADDPDRTTEVLPGRDRSVLGRLLAALGAPPGRTSGGEPPALPAYLTHPDCPYRVRLDFGRVVVRNRGVPRSGAAAPVRLVGEGWVSAPRLRRFLGRVVGDEEAVWGEKPGATVLSKRAAAVLCPRPTLGAWLGDETRERGRNRDPNRGRESG